MTGVELLMNHNTKKKDESKADDDMNIELDDLTSLENDLNALTANGNDGIKLNLSADTEPLKLNVDEPEKVAKTASPGITKLGEPEKTWDGYQQFNNIPINPDKAPKEINGRRTS